MDDGSYSAYSAPYSVPRSNHIAESQKELMRMVHDLKGALEDTVQRMDDAVQRVDDTVQRIGLLEDKVTHLTEVQPGPSSVSSSEEKVRIPSVVTVSVDNTYVCTAQRVRSYLISWELIFSPFPNLSK